MVDVDRKKVFLQQGSELYKDMIALTDCTVKRYLAFRIIVNGMSFEDLVGGPALRDDEGDEKHAAGTQAAGGFLSGVQRG